MLKMNVKKKLLGCAILVQMIIVTCIICIPLQSNFIFEKKITDNPIYSQTNTSGSSLILSNPWNGSIISGNVTISILAADPDGIYYVVLFIDNNSAINLYTGNTSVYEYIWNTSTVPNGTHRILISSITNNFNIKTILLTVITNNVIGNNGPSLTINYPVNGTTVNGNVTIKASASYSSTIKSVAFYIDNNLALSDTSEPYEFIWDTTALADGYHTILVSAKTFSIQHTDLNISVFISNNNPTTTQTSSSSSTTTSSSSLSNTTLTMTVTTTMIFNLTIIVTSTTILSDTYPNSNSETQNSTKILSSNAPSFEFLIFCLTIFVALTLRKIKSSLK